MNLTLPTHNQALNFLIYFRSIAVMKYKFKGVGWELHKLLLVVFLFIICGCSTSLDFDGEFKRGQVAFVDKNYSKAYQIWEPLAEAGFINAQDTLAYLYLQGLGIEQNYKKAISWYTASAENGQIEAMYNLGNIYREGKIAERDLKKAEIFYRESYCGGFPLAIIGLTELYKTGDLTVQSEMDKKSLEEHIVLLKDPRYVQLLINKTKEVAHKMTGCDKKT